MNQVSVDIMNFLGANGFGTVGTDLFAMAWGEGIDEQILVMDGFSVSSANKTNHEQANFKVLARGKAGADLNTTANKLRAVHEFLIQEPTQIINGVQYLQFEPISTIIGLGRDPEDRGMFSMNYYTFRPAI